MTESTFAVRNIWETEGDYCRVSIDSDTFNKIKGFSPALRHVSTTRNAKGQGLRIYNIDGITLYSRYDKETRKTSFIMKHSDAVAHLRTLEQERSQEPSLAFSL